MFDGVQHYSPDGDEPLIFYGGPLSNFVSVDGLWVQLKLPWSQRFVLEEFPTTEHAFQAAKAVNRSDFFMVKHTPHPGAAKAIGRGVELRQDWEAVKFDVMVECLRAKFMLDEWREMLLGTGDRQIIEDSPTDFIWGMRDSEGGWSGRNLLGEALMKVRGELRRTFGVAS